MATKRQAPKSAFKPGTSGNPKGKPAGTRSKATQLLVSLMEGHAEAITNAVIEQARQGELIAARIILDRLIPPAKERPIHVDLPDTSTSEGVSAAQAAILKAVGNGDLLPGEAQTLSNIVEAKRRAHETQELADRITKLESERHGNT